MYGIQIMIIMHGCFTESSVVTTHVGKQVLPYIHISRYQPSNKLLYFPATVIQNLSWSENPSVF